MKKEQTEPQASRKGNKKEDKKMKSLKQKNHRQQCGELGGKGKR